MKKLLVVLLSLALIAGFSMTASALDFKLSGGWHAAGTYQDNPNLLSDEAKYSRATVYTRTRLQPVLQISDGLTFTMRLDALEKKWGDTNFKNTNAAAMSTSNSDDTTSSRRFYSTANTVAGNAKLQENIEFERAYVTFKSPVGIWQIGYQQSGVWGTKGLQQDSTRPRVMWTLPSGPWTLLAIWEKRFDGGESPSNSNAPTRLTDADYDQYNLAFNYNNGKNWQGGLLYQYNLVNQFRAGTSNGWQGALGYGSTAGFSTKINLLSPYVQATFGNLFVEGEVMYFFGKLLEQETPTAANPDVDINGLGIFAHAKMALGPGYVGLQFHYTSGDDMKDATKSTWYPGPTTTWTPAIILLDDDMADWMGSTSTNGLNQSSGKTNSTIFSAYAGYNVNPKLNLEVDFTYAMASEKALTRTPYTEAVSDKMGYELDVSATYRIYDNLTYTIAAGYLWTGDYFKGANAAAQIGDNYCFLNRLILPF